MHIDMIRVPGRRILCSGERASGKDAAVVINHKLKINFAGKAACLN
jgi:hypothetical protein